MKGGRKKGERRKEKEKGRREEAERRWKIRCYVALLQWIEYGGVYSG